MNLLDNTILLTLSGSRAYGMHNDNSDIDLHGVLIPDREYIFGFNKRCEQYNSSEEMKVFVPLLEPNLQRIAQETKLEGTVYAIQKFFALASDCNPNLIQTIFCEKDCILKSTPLGDKLIEHRDMFLSKNARFRFSGYAMQQLKRLQSHRQYLLSPMTEPPNRSDFGLKETYEIPKAELLAARAAVAKQLDCWSDGFIHGVEESTKMRIRESIAQLLAELKVMENHRLQLACTKLGFDSNFIGYFQKEHEYFRACQDWDKYQKWQRDRNPERAKMEAEFGYDGKHASHLVRLMRMCIEILRDGQVLVKRPDAQELLQIRNGLWTYERLIEYAAEMDAEAANLYQTSSLRKVPDINFLDNLCMELVEEFLADPMRKITDERRERHKASKVKIYDLSDPTFVSPFS